MCGALVTGALPAAALERRSERPSLRPSESRTARPRDLGWEYKEEAEGRSRSALSVSGLCSGYS